MRVRMAMAMAMVMGVVCGAVAARAQAAAAPAFEVSTVRVSHAANGSSDSRFDHGRFVAENVPLKNLMEYSAYGIPQMRILGGPKWIDSQRFDIEAKMDDATARELESMAPAVRRATMQRMFQRLLADRFQLAVHWETRELPVYRLVLKGRGARLKASTAKPGEGGSSASRGRLSVTNTTTAELASVLTQELNDELGRPVVDATGLQGRYDVALEWTPTSEGGASQQREDGSAADTGPSIFTAVQEQLGLKLMPGKGPVQVLVIDSVKLPTGN